MFFMHNFSTPFKSTETLPKNGFIETDIENFTPALRQYLHDKLVHELEHYFAPARPLLAALKNKKAVVAGGFLEALLTGRPVEDIDIYCTKPVCDSVIECLREVSFNQVPALVNSTPHMEEWLYKNTPFSTIKLQFIFNRGSELRYVLDSFDFTCVKCGFTVFNDHFSLNYNDSFFSDVYHRTLSIDSDGCLSDDGRSTKTMARLVKYISRGYSTKPETLQKILDSIAKHGSGKVYAPGSENYKNKEE